ncbi:unnamed protein product [Brachionus calyciflorus]|uniref:Uncharacterized protein n=1 Tax=Brachionus calyciflorus TaxID=104777 RepID=A0A813SM52_9BILA|nr:unnamed protein product [Brachionus calyciflorus]
MSEENINIPGHSPAMVVGGMRVSKPYHPVSLTEEKSHEKRLKPNIEFVEHNSREIVYVKENKLGVVVNGKQIDVKDAYPTQSVRSFHENKPMGKYPLDHMGPKPSYFQPKSFNENVRMPNR